MNISYIEETNRIDNLIRSALEDGVACEYRNTYKFNFTELPDEKQKLFIFDLINSEDELLLEAIYDHIQERIEWRLNKVILEDKKNQGYKIDHDPQTGDVLFVPDRNCHQEI